MNDRNIYILVIDDEVPILKMLKLQLTRMGFNVDTAESGGEGIEKINSNTYDLIFTDIKMPDISGDQILRYVKSKKGNTLPVIGMSGTPWLLDQNNFNAVLSKPCSFKDTLATINHLINQNS